jgi:hypothetical protein
MSVELGQRLVCASDAPAHRLCRNALRRQTAARVRELETIHNFLPEQRPLSFGLAQNEKGHPEDGPISQRLTVGGVGGRGRPARATHCGASGAGVAADSGVATVKATLAPPVAEAETTEPPVAIAVAEPPLPPLPVPSSPLLCGPCSPASPPFPPIATAGFPPALTGSPLPPLTSQESSQKAPGVPSAPITVSARTPASLTRMKASDGIVTSSK